VGSEIAGKWVNRVADREAGREVVDKKVDRVIDKAVGMKDDRMGTCVDWEVGTAVVTETGLIEGLVFENEQEVPQQMPWRATQPGRGGCWMRNSMN